MLHQGSSAAPASWCTYWTARLTNRAGWGGMPLTTRPSSRISPLVSRWMPSRVRPSVVLPQPDSPTSPSVSPARSDRDTPPTARTGSTAGRSHRFCPPSRTTTSRASRIGSPGLIGRLLPLVGEAAADEMAPARRPRVGRRRAQTSATAAARREAAAGRRCQRRRHQPRVCRSAPSERSGWQASSARV